MDTVEYIEKLESELNLQAQKTQDVQHAYASNLFDPADNENLIKWQLSIKEELNRIEHLLRKHVPRTDKDGNEYYENAKPEDEIFNDTGVNEVMLLV